MLLAAEPMLILLDEPAAGMTRDEVARTAKLIRDMQATRSVIVVEHDMKFVRMIGGLVTVFHQGAILAEDTMDNIVRDPRVRDVYLGKSGHANA
jgi:branched-chain amino acid transport system ATP-binding protein/urea transport system ATP-binding protein